MEPTTVSDEGWARLHDLRLRGMATLEDDGHTAALVENGWVKQRGPMFVLTPEGKAAHTAWARLEPGSEAEAAARRAYDRFLELDMVVKQVVTDWQLKAGTGEGFSVDEWAIVDRLQAVDEKAGAMLRPLGAAVERFAGYRPRLRAALEQINEGERQYFSGMKCDSYHTVWWHLHEDLLVGLGIDRSDDPNQ